MWCIQRSEVAAFSNFILPSHSKSVFSIKSHKWRLLLNLKKAVKIFNNFICTNTQPHSIKGHSLTLSLSHTWGIRKHTHSLTEKTKTLPDTHTHVHQHIEQLLQQRLRWIGLPWLCCAGCARCYGTLSLLKCTPFYLPLLHISLTRSCGLQTLPVCEMRDPSHPVHYCIVMRAGSRQVCL